jgi:hypothetical protein
VMSRTSKITAMWQSTELCSEAHLVIADQFIVCSKAQ